jgi:hypothetical protein
MKEVALLRLRIFPERFICCDNARIQCFVVREPEVPDTQFFSLTGCTQM